MKKLNYRARRIIAMAVILVSVAIWLIINPGSYESKIVQDDQRDQASQENQNSQTDQESQESQESQENLATKASQVSQSSQVAEKSALSILEKLEIKGRAPKTGYDRSEQFYKSWPNINGCSLRQIIIKRELSDSAQLAENNCDVIAGTFVEPYTGSQMTFHQKSDFSTKIQIDHIVALSDAWQKGAQNKTKEERYALATDPLNLVAVDAAANKQKSDGDAATWLPPNKPFRCQYVARQVSVKYKYNLWVTQAEHDAIVGVLQSCPNEPAVGI